VVGLADLPCGACRSNQRRHATSQHTAISIASPREQLLDLLQILLACRAGAGPVGKRPHAVAPPNATITRSGLRAPIWLVRLME
jgi:hypothetical protein